MYICNSLFLCVRGWARFILCGGRWHASPVYTLYWKSKKKIC